VAAGAFAASSLRFWKAPRARGLVDVGKPLSGTTIVTIWLRAEQPVSPEVELGALNSLLLPTVPRLRPGREGTAVGGWCSGSAGGRLSAQVARLGDGCSERSCDF
jgi:hypothetical protein